MQLDKNSRHPAKDFLSRAVHYTGDDCLFWPFSRTIVGYALVKHEGRMRIASRVVCELAKGLPPAPHYEAAHSCGNGHLGCVNPNHLEWKTSFQNQQDKVLHGTHMQGEKHWARKLTSKDVQAIRRLRGELSQSQIGQQFGVSQTTVGKILRGERWKSVAGGISR